MSNVILIAKAIIAIKEILDRIYEAIERRADESAREKITQLRAAYEAASANEEKRKAAREIQARLGLNGGAADSKLSDDK
jgi:hypothetical protein